jgi:hypothetical protein
MAVTKYAFCRPFKENHLISNGWLILGFSALQNNSDLPQGLKGAIGGILA